MPQALAQQAELRQGVGLTAKLGKGWSWTLEDQVRFDVDAPRYRSSLFETTVRKRLAKWVRVGAGYRLRLSPTEWQHRTHLDGVFYYQPKGLPIELRGLLRCQYAFPTWNSPAQFAFRQRLTAFVQVTKSIRPFLYFEGQTVRLEEWTRFNRLRTGVGLEYALSKRNTLEILYFYQTPFNQETVEGRHVLSIAFELDVDWSREDKGK